jgi:hypothetical protein
MKQNLRQARTEASATGSIDPISEYWQQLRERTHS